MSKKFPKIIFIKREEEGTDNEYLNCCEEVEDCAVVGETERVAVYKLEGIKKVTAKVQIEIGK